MAAAFFETSCLFLLLCGLPTWFGSVKLERVDTSYQVPTISVFVNIPFFFRAEGKGFMEQKIRRPGWRGLNSIKQRFKLSADLVPEYLRFMPVEKLDEVRVCVDHADSVVFIGGLVVFPYRYEPCAVDFAMLVVASVRRLPAEVCASRNYQLRHVY